MRQALTLLVIILVAVGLYTAFGLITFTPDEAKDFVFEEPTLPPELAGEASSAPPEVALTPEQQQQTTAAMARLTQAVALYQDYEKNSSGQAASTFNLLNTAIINGKLPAYLLTQARNQEALRNFELITLDPKKIGMVAAGQPSLNCGSGSTGYDILVGDNTANTLNCEAPLPTAPLDRVFLGGPGDDKIISAAGSRIINAGTGDDSITAGLGRTIILLDGAWGHDTLTVDCSGTTVDKSEIVPGFPVPWVHPFTNFIVLAPSINLADIEWQGLVLTNKTTGDTLSVNENCFNLISAGN